MSDPIDDQTRLLSETVKLTAALTQLTESLSASTMTAVRGRSPDQDKLSPEPDHHCPGVSEQAVAAAALQHVYLGYEIDQCSGQLKVKDKSGNWITIPRGQTTAVNVAPDGNGYWYWECGSSLEWSRGDSNYRQRVNHLHVYHSTENRQITWWCYQLV
jgi:hypothetical protein